jgi:hypothetical protein
LLPRKAPKFNIVPRKVKAELRKMDAQKNVSLFSSIVPFQRAKFHFIVQFLREKFYCSVPKKSFIIQFKRNVPLFRFQEKSFTVQFKREKFHRSVPKINKFKKQKRDGLKKAQGSQSYKKKQERKE